MRNKIAAAAIIGALCSGPVLADDLEERAAQSRAAAQAFMGQLKAELQAAIKAGGPESAIGVCKDKAPRIAASLGDAKGWKVGRTSLKVRNPANAPDDWERSVLQEFEARKAAGEDLQTMEKADVVEAGGKRSYRYMKAIPTADLCVVCHGAVVPPAVEAKLQALYPEDQARGFEPGDLRGTFTITQPMEN